MARKSDKNKRIENAKKGAPDIPPNTCPYIDLVLNFIENEVVIEGETGIDNQRRQLIVDCMEYIRSANDSLRRSSYFWYSEYKKIA